MDTCIETPYARSGLMGYGQIELEGKAVMHHRLVYCETNNVTLDSIATLVVRHTCDNPRCVNPAHLLLGTHADNSKDRGERKRTAVGSRVGRAKVTEAQVLEIRARRGGSNKSIGLEFGLDPSCISDILTRKTWKHI